MQAPPGFPKFEDLPDLCQLRVFSFVASAPLEQIYNVVDFSRNQVHSGTMGSTLSRVCRKFREFCHADALWRASLERAIAHDKVWNDAVHKRLVPRLPSDTDTDDMDSLLSALRRHLHVSSSKNLYQVLLGEHIRVRLPIFFMPQTEPIGQYQIHFFEPRYRMMMSEVMNEQNTDPVFLHVIDMRGPRAKAAALIRVVACAFATDGRSVATLQQVGSVKLRQCWERPQSMGLYYGDGYRCDDIALAEPMPHRWSYRVFN